MSGDGMRFNICNSRKRGHHRGRRTSSRFKGVIRHHGKWQARLTVDGHRRSLGHFDNELDAARAYDAAAQLHYGDFARVNGVSR